MKFQNISHTRRDLLGKNSDVRTETKQNFAHDKVNFDKIVKSADFEKKIIVGKYANRARGLTKNAEI